MRAIRRSAAFGREPVLILVSALITLAACSKSDPAPTGPADGVSEPVAASITLQPRVAKLWATGETFSFEAVGRDADGAGLPDASVSWRSSVPAVATVDASGVATAAADGWTVITASVGSLEAASDAVVITPAASPDRIDCLACHGAEYASRHAGSNTPGACLLCHRPGTWHGPAVDHEAVSGGFRLLGAHAGAACTACHEADGTPLYPGATDGDCCGCHAADYDARHAGSGFPKECLLCHDTTAWANAAFDHDADNFPIFSGRHFNKWQECATCHVNPDDFGAFSCFACHVHEQWRMDPAHEEVTGYAYDSALCYACHPKGEAG
jgi:hypothetical protein